MPTDDEVIEFPCGVPGFESERRFRLQAPAELAPLVIMRSLSDPELAFVTAPVQWIDAGYRLAAIAEDWAQLGLDAASGAAAGEDLMCLVILTLAEGQAPTANLMAPVLIRRSTGKAVQAVRDDGAYSHRHPLPSPGGQECL